MSQNNGSIYSIAYPTILFILIAISQRNIRNLVSLVLFSNLAVLLILLIWGGQNEELQRASAYFLNLSLVFSLLFAVRLYIEKRYKNSLKLITTLLDNWDEYIFLADTTDNKIIYKNRKTEELLADLNIDGKNIKSEEVMGLLIADKDRNRLNNAIEDIKLLPGSWSDRLEGKKESLKWLTVTAQLIYVEMRKFIYIKLVGIDQVVRDEQSLGLQMQEIEKNNEELERARIALTNVLEDISQEKEKVKVEKQKLETILNNIAEGVLVINHRGDLIHVNNSALEILGLDDDVSEVLDKKYEEVIRFTDEKTTEQSVDFVKIALEEKKIARSPGSTLLLTREGKSIPIDEVATPLIGKKGKLIGVVITIRDVSLEREVDNMKSEFISIASHQLRTPLTAIRWYLETVMEEKDQLNEAIKESLETVYDSNLKMISLVNDLLSVSRIEAGRKFTIKKEVTDIVKLLSDTIKVHKPEASVKSIKIDMKMDIKSLEIKVDAEKITQAITNLISNAIKYSPAGSTVTIKLKTENKKCIIEVIDKGIGIPQSEQKNIFGKFFRAENVLAKQIVGNGLGLYICKAIVEGHKGKITFSSKEGQGTVFILSLPL
jgi:PAS domain S-box-containing protein